MDNLKASRFSARGFLGTDSRPLDEIISEDMSILGKHQVSKKRLVEALEDVYNKAKEALGTEVVIRPGVKAVFYEAMGRIPSPFPGEGVFEKGEAILTEMDSGDVLNITRLGIHLIAKHGFFQGQGSPYRIDPIKVLKILHLSEGEATDSPD